MHTIINYNRICEPHLMKAKKITISTSIVNTPLIISNIKAGR